MESAIKALQEGKCVAILDDESREGETDLFFPAISLTAGNVRMLRNSAGGELYISVSNHVSTFFGLPYVGKALSTAGATEVFPVLASMQKFEGDMCQGSCSVGLSLDHRSTHTGAPDIERSFTCRRLAELWEELLKKEPKVCQGEAIKALGAEFHVPGHIFLCMENKKGLEVRSGHTELSVALAKLAGITPIMVGCVMLSNEGEDFGALSPEKARKWAAENNVPFLNGKEIIQYFFEKSGVEASPYVNGH